ncbi:NAD(P)-binding protein [Violaceomyces palustris]|uniref:NAD(P)-binding protein n=1 Tax=Violaceomyces palustris TaxID=1673888 RepID=A0ACD0NL48_9BASI|nr:NAD(P)-binding protein [Violaceomyces palustris]
MIRQAACRVSRRSGFVLPTLPPSCSASRIQPSCLVRSTSFSTHSALLQSSKKEGGGGIGTGTTKEVSSQPSRRSLASLSLDGKICLVTGGARGIGNVIARTFIEAGSDRLALVDLNEKESKRAAEEVEGWFLEQGLVRPGQLDVRGFGCDISKEEEVMRVMGEVRNHFGRSVDVAVNSAGIVENFPATEYPTEKIKKLFEINVQGSFFVGREVAKQMLEEGVRGSIILIASMSGRVVNVPQPQSPYNASKAAVRQMASSFAVEWAKSGIRVNSLSPGYMLTPLTRQVLESSPQGNQLAKIWEDLTPMARLGDPQDLKGAVVYLASDASSFTTGTDLLVDGGYTAV